jgi:hypothetical protein
MISPLSATPFTTPLPASQQPPQPSRPAVNDRSTTNETVAISPCAQLAAEMKAEECNYGKS